MGEKPSSILYFAYGADIDPREMRQIDERCESMGVARTEGQRLAFTPDGWANLGPEPGAVAWGILWLVPATHLAAMDAAAATRGFVRDVMFVVSPAGPRVPATTYRHPTASGGRPQPEAIAALVAGARAAKLDKAYIAELERWGARG